MTCWKLGLGLWAILIAVGVSAASAQQLNPQQIQIINDTAASICNTVKDAKGQRSELQIQGDVKAQLNGLIGKVVDIGGTTKGSLTREEFDGLSRDATAAALDGDRGCRERVFNKMFDKLGSTSQELPLSLARIQLANWVPQGWDILLTNPSNKKIAITRGTLVTPETPGVASAGSTFVDIAQDEDSRDEYQLEITRLPGSDAPLEIGPEKTTTVRANAFYCAGDGPAISSTLDFKISHGLFRGGEQCKVCFELTALDGDSVDKCDTFDCRKIRKPSLACLSR